MTMMTAMTEDNFTFTPSESLNQEQQQELFAKLEKAGQPRKKRSKKTKNRGPQVRGSKLSATKSPIINHENVAELARRLRELGYVMTGAVIGDKGAGEIEIAKVGSGIRYTVQDSGHIVQDPAPAPASPGDEPEPTLCGNPKTDRSDLGCWNCQKLLPEPLSRDFVAAFGSRGVVVQTQTTRYSFLLDGTPRSKSCAGQVKRDVRVAVALTSLNTEASYWAISAMKHYASGQSHSNMPRPTTTPGELIALGLIAPVGRDGDATVYALTAQGQKLADAWEKARE